MILYTNAKVYTGELPLVEAFAVEGGLFVFAGSAAEGAALNADEVVDLNGQFVCAGFNDSHMHLLNYGQSLMQAPLGEHTTSIADMLQCLRDFAQEHPVQDGKWLRGRGWNHDYFTDQPGVMPTRHDLDKVSTEYPILIVRCCGHGLAINTKALEICGITAETPAPEGGMIGHDSDGEPNGIFFDDAMDLVYNNVPTADKDEIKEMIRAACKALNSYGVTSSQTDDYCVFRKTPWQTVNEAYEELEESGELTVRVYEQSNFTTLESLTEFVEAGNTTGTGTDMFKIGPLKMLGDGALGTRTAYMLEPYSDDPSTCGIPVFNQEQFDELVGYANAHDMQVAIHSIGDGSLEMILNAVEKALAEHPRDDHRHGIVHCQITTPEQLKRIADNNMHVYMQSIFLDYDIHIVEDRVGHDRAETSYRWKTLKDMGVTVSNGTDCPVELPDEMKGIQCLVTRSTIAGDGPYLPEEAFSMQEALDSYTSVSAYSSFEENVKGRIAPGYMADFVVLGSDPFEANPSEIYQIPIQATYLAGNCVFSR